jgi:hypothetical protein
MSEKPASGDVQQPPQRAAFQVTLSRRWLVGVAILLLVPWVAVMVIAFSCLPQKGSGTHAIAVPPPGSYKCEPGPWGDLECIPITIAPPPEFIEAFDPEYLNSAWNFPNVNPDQLRTLLAGVEMPEAQRAAMLAAARPMPAINGYVIQPQGEWVRGLKPQARAILYNGLGHFKENRAQAEAFRFCADSPDQWLSEVELSPATRDLVKSLMYRNGRYWFFADLAYVLPRLTNEAEKKNLLKVLSSEKDLFVKLCVQDEKSVNPLVDYWGRGGRATDVQPLLEAIGQVQGTTKISISLLLPGFARRLVHTYPTPSMDPQPPRHDCHWTAFNFFNEQPDERFTHSEFILKTLRSDYYPVYSDFALGDIVMFVDRQENVLHTAVYVADGILFTKSGNRSSTPWMFARLDDLKEFYPSSTPITIRYYRHKGV